MNGMFDKAVLVLKFPEGMESAGIRVFRVFDGQLRLITHTPQETEHQVIQQLERHGIKRLVPFDTDDGISGLWASGDEQKQEGSDVRANTVE